MSLPARENARGAIQPVTPIHPPLPLKPVILDAADAALAGVNTQKLKLIDAPGPRKKQSAMVTGLRDLQQLQKQTIAVLEAVKGNLEDIRQVLRSPEATRGMEKQQNAAALLAKGFAAEAAAQARGAVEHLPANPEAHLLLSLSLAANQEFDEALAAARKGLLLFDRRQHPLAIEAGLLHALAALGHGAEAAARWQEIVEALPVPVLLEHIGRIAVCYPSQAPEGQLDGVLSRRITRDPDRQSTEPPPASMFAGLDAARQHRLMETQRALLVRITLIAKRLREPAPIVRFLGDYVVGLAERGDQRAAAALAKRAVRHLLAAHADAPTLHRALLKLQLAGKCQAGIYVADLLAHWRHMGLQNRRANIALTISLLLLILGGALFGHAALGLHYLPAAPWGSIRGLPLHPLFVGLAIVGVATLTALAVFLRRYPVVDLPMGRGALTADELRFLRSRAVRDSLREK